MPPTPSEDAIAEVARPLDFGSKESNRAGAAHRTFRVKLLSREIALAHFVF